MEVAGKSFDVACGFARISRNVLGYREQMSQSISFIDSTIYS